MSGSATSIIDEITRDVRAFADPGSDVIAEPQNLFWEQGGAIHDVGLRQSANGPWPDIRLNGAWINYKSFLASAHLADLHQLAQFVVKTTVEETGYVDTLAVGSDEEEEEPQPTEAVDLIESRSTKNLPFQSTRILLVGGEAGSGKTMSLRKMTLRRAQKYLAGHAKSLFFYVDVQGRSLSRLDDAMARQLDDLRAKFPYSAVVPLVRHGLLIPVVDGFDELLGSGGYDDAFASLAAFVARLEGAGVVVASARSSFFDYNNFREYASRFGYDGRLGYGVDTVELQPWDEAQADSFVSLRTGGQGPPDGVQVLANFRKLRRELDKPELLSKPFYVSKITELLIEGESLSSGNTVIGQLVGAFVNREHRKLLGNDGTPLLTPEQHRLFLTELAMEMWLQESRRLDFDTVQELGALLAEDYGLPRQTVAAIRQRASSYAFLTTVETNRRALRFEHEVFYSYFLAEKLGQCLRDGSDDLRRFLDRSVLDDMTVRQAIRLANADNTVRATVIESICSILQPGMMHAVARENGGRIVAGLLTSGGRLRPGGTLRHLNFRHDKLGPIVLDRPHFYRCDFQTVDFTDARVESPRFEECTLSSPKIALGTTRFERATEDLAAQVHGIFVETGDEDFPKGECFAPDSVRAILARLGADIDPGHDQPVAGYTSNQKARIDLLAKFLHKMERRFYVSKNDLEKFSTTRAPQWPVLRQLLEKHELLTEQFVRKSGPSEPLLRLSHPPRIIRAGEDTRDRSRPDVTAFWGDLLEHP